MTNVTSINDFITEKTGEAFDARKDAVKRMNQDVIIVLEEALHRARMGDVVAISVNWVEGHWCAPVNDDGTVAADLRMFAPLRSDGIECVPDTLCSTLLVGATTVALEEIQVSAARNELADEH